MIVRDKKGRFLSKAKAEKLATRKGPRSSSFKGVSFHVGNNKWISRFYKNGKQKWVGTFDSEYSAYLALCQKQGIRPVANPNARTANIYQAAIKNPVTFVTNPTICTWEAASCQCTHDIDDNRSSARTLPEVNVTIDADNLDNLNDQVANAVSRLVNQVKDFFQEVSIDYNRISQRAYDIYVRKGYSGSEEENWHEAEAELRAEASAGKIIA